MKTKSQTVNQLYAEFLSRRPSRLGNGSPYNRRNYEQRLRRFRELYGETAVSKITSEHVDGWIAEIAHPGLRPATLTGYRQAIKALFNYAVSKGKIRESPAAHLATGSTISQRPQKPPRAAVDRITDLALRWLQSDRRVDLRDGLIFMLSRSCGPRRGEIIALRCRDVVAALQAGPNELGIYQVGSFGKTGESVVRFSEVIASGVCRWLAVRPDSPTDALFTTTRRPYGPLHIGGINHIYERVSAAAGLSRTIRSHALRHFVGDETTRRHGAKVAAMLLNHADADTAATAIAYYHHPDDADVSIAVAEMIGPAPAELAEMRRLFGLA